MGWRMHLEAERGDTSMLMPVEESGREETRSSFALLLPQTLVQSIPFSGNPGISTITLQVMDNGGGGQEKVSSHFSAYWTKTFPGTGRRWMAALVLSSPKWYRGRASRGFLHSRAAVTHWLSVGSGQSAGLGTDLSEFFQPKTSVSTWILWLILHFISFFCDLAFNGLHLL